METEFSDRTLGSRMNLLTLLDRFKVRVSKTISNDENFLVYLSSAADAENLFSEEVTYAL